MAFTNLLDRENSLSGNENSLSESEELLSDAEGVQMTPLEIHNQLRGRIRHENQLLASRLGWLMAFQAFLLSPFVATYDGASGGELQKLIPVVGIASCFLGGLGIYGALFTIHVLYQRDKNLAKGNGFLQRLDPDIGKPRRPRVTHWMSMFFPILAPIGLICFWLALLDIASAGKKQTTDRQGDTNQSKVVQADDETNKLDLGAVGANGDANPKSSEEAK